MKTTKHFLLAGLVGFVFLTLFACSETTEPTPAPSAPSLIDPGMISTTGNYSVSWNHSFDNLEYLLQESTNVSFSTPRTAYSGPNYSTEFESQTNGTYFYRLKASNANGASNWSNTVDITVDIAETISRPGMPWGSPTGNVGQTLTYSITGAASSFGHPLYYQFDWGDGNESDWLETTSASHLFYSPGTYFLRARARCQDHSQVYSLWSNHSLQVDISSSAHEVSTPNHPSGPTIGMVNQLLTYFTSGALCSQGHSVEYRFDWNDLPHSTWSSSLSEQKSWNYANYFYIKAQARCSVDHLVISDWSWFLPVDIQEPETINGSPGVCGSAAVRVNVNGSWWACGIPESSLGHDLEWRINWDDGTYSEWSTSSQFRSFTEPRIYNLRAQARCIRHPNVVSSWGATIPVSVTY